MVTEDRRIGRALMLIRKRRLRETKSANNSRPQQSGMFWGRKVYIVEGTHAMIFGSQTSQSNPHSRKDNLYVFKEQSLYMNTLAVSNASEVGFSYRLIFAREMRWI